MPASRRAALERIAIATLALAPTAWCAADPLSQSGTQAPETDRAQPRRAGPPARAGTLVPAASAPQAGDGSPGRGHPSSAPPPPLQAIAQASFAAGRPLVVMFSLRGCPWCDALRREHFAGLAAAQQVLGINAIELDLMDTRQFADPPAGAAHDARPTRLPSLQADSPRELGQRYRVRLAPTVIFIGPAGEIAERLTGYGSPDFFGAYLEQRIAQARSAITQR